MKMKTGKFITTIFIGFIVATTFLTVAKAVECEEGYVKGVKTGNCIKIDGSCGTGCSYTIDEKGIIHMTGNGNGVVGGHIIRNNPYNADIIGVDIGEGIKTIGFRAFNQDGFRYLTIAEGVTTIEAESTGTPIKVLVIPSNVTSLGSIGNANTVKYCTEQQIANCGSNAVLYEKKGNLYYVYDSDNNISEIYGGYGNFNNNVLKEPNERDTFDINDDGSVSIMDKNGKMMATYSQSGVLMAQYNYGTDGSVSIYDANGKLIGLQGKRILTVEEATALVKDNKNTFKLKYR